MWCLSKPGREKIRQFISAQEGKQFSYPHAGASRDRVPDGYNVDHNRIQLGHGADVLERAKNAIREWKMFDMPWVELCWPDTPIKVDATVAVLISHFGFWSLNACRIVYEIDERGACERFGFAYGTLPHHGERGEERFSVEFHTADQSVWYDLYAFSRPGPAACLAYPYTRALQKRFATDSKEAMRRATQREGDLDEM
jgi:uncharacterized protein (UPF0548 family)